MELTILLSEFVDSLILLGQRLHERGIHRLKVFRTTVLEFMLCSTNFADDILQPRVNSPEVLCSRQRHCERRAGGSGYTLTKILISDL